MQKVSVLMQDRASCFGWRNMIYKYYPIGISQVANADFRGKKVGLMAFFINFIV